MDMRLGATVVEGIHTLFNYGTMVGCQDDRLVAQLRNGQEGREAALRMLIYRHGPMVMGICRRILGDEHAAEDAFQATFLVLLKKAATLRDRDLLANWLHGVARRVATKEKAKAARRRLVERSAGGRVGAQSDDVEKSELRTVIDEEIGRLPERYRVPLILYYMEGLHLDAFASRLGCPMGTIQSRLSRARDKLQSRLARRGLAPTASALVPMLGAPDVPALPLSLVESVVRNAFGAGLWGAAGTATGPFLKPVLGLLPSMRACVLAASLLTGAGAVAMGWGIHRTAGVASIPPSARAEAPARVEPETTAAVTGDPNRAGPQADRTMPPPLPDGISARQGIPPESSRSHSAIAVPLSGITIDGRLDDWPANLTRHPIRNQFITHETYDPRERRPTRDAYGDFMVGYNRESGLIYVAVVVKDDENVLPAAKKPRSDRVVFETDAVEIFVDGNHSDSKYVWKVPSTSATWQDILDASEMPVLQYVGVPGPVPAYADQTGANPTLMYGRIRQTGTVMKYRRESGVTTYEWAVQAFDHYPDRPTRLNPNKKVGFDVAIVAKDRVGPPAYLTWGPAPTFYKGCDAGSLGELIFAESP